MSRIPLCLSATAFPKAFKHHIALFADESAFVTVTKADYDADEPVTPEWMSKYIQITDWVEVTLPAIPAEAYVLGQLKTFEEEEKEITAKYLTALDRLKTKRAEFIAITHQGETKD